MKQKFSYFVCTLVLALSSFSVFSATQSILLFQSNPNTASGRIMNSSQATNFAKNSIVLNCLGSHTVIISSTADGSGKILVDNFLSVDGTNVCPGGPNSAANCFVGSGTGEINPINISNAIANGKHLVTFELMDWGKQLQNSPLYLVMTGCTVAPRETICHKPGTNGKRQIVVSQSVISEHLGHGDTFGVCQ